MRLASLLVSLLLSLGVFAKSISFYSHNNTTIVNDCNFNYAVDSPNSSVTINELTGTHVKVKLLNDDWNPVLNCTDNCPDPIIVENLEDGEYYINVIYFDDDWEIECNTLIPIEIVGGSCTDIDGDGYCADVDCNDTDPFVVPQTPATSCNDNDGFTINDQILADGCTCAGTPVTANCNINITIDNNGGITIEGIFGAITKVRVYDAGTWDTEYSCTDDCENEIYINGLGEGYYNLDVNLYYADGTLFCNHNEYFTLAPGSCTDNDGDGSCADVDCDDNNATIPGTPGNSCDDLNSATVNDEIQQDGCTCIGTDYPGPCNISYLAGYNSVSVSGLVAEHVKVKLYDSEWDLVFNCSDNCAQEEVIASLTHEGEYFLKVELFDDDWAHICSLEEYFVVTDGSSCTDSDGDGYCQDVDCDDNDASWPKAPGTACDDYNAATENDVIQYDGCTCAGELSDPCGQILVDIDNETIKLSNFPAGYISSLKIFNDWSLFFQCSGNCDDPTVLNDMEEGTYQVMIKLMDDNWEVVCNVSYEIIINSIAPIIWNNGENSLKKDAVSAETRNSSTSDPELQLYPNPSSGELFINLDELDLESFDIIVYNAMGQIVKTTPGIHKQDGLVILNTAELNTGVYFLRIRDKDGPLIGKQFVKE